MSQYIYIMDMTYYLLYNSIITCEYFTIRIHG